MSITRLQQARQMYAMGQRVAKTLDGSRPGYRGSDMATVSAPGQNTAQQGTQDTSGADYGGGNQGGQTSTTDDRSSDTQQYNHYEAISKNTGVDNNPLRPSGIEPGFIKPGDIDGLTIRPYEQRGIDFLGTDNTPKYVPASLKFLANFNNKPNRDYFYNNVIGAGKIPGISRSMNAKDLEQAYEDYMNNRMAGKTDAAGNPTQGFSYGDDGLTGNFIDDSDDSQNNGIMTVANNTTDDTTDDTNEDGSLILRYLHDYPNEVVNLQAMGVKDTDEMLQVMLDRAENLYTT